MKYNTDPAYTKERAEQQRKEAFEEIRKAAEEFEETLDQMSEYLHFAGRFAYHYSVNNTMMIYRQNRDAAFCRSFQAWKKDGYSVKRGEKGMKILTPVIATILKLPDGSQVPLKYAEPEQKRAYREGRIPGIQRQFFRIGTTFDVAQTTFPPEKYPELFQRGYSSEEAALLLEALIEYAEKELSCPVVFGNDEMTIHGARTYGYYHMGTREIHLASTLKDTAALATLTHELGHALMLGDIQAEEQIPSTAQMEFEADCMRHLLCGYLGAEIPVTARKHLADCYYAYRHENEEKKAKEIVQDAEAAQNAEASQDTDKTLADIPLLQSFHNVFDVYRRELPKINGYLEAKLPGHIPEERRKEQSSEQSYESKVTAETISYNENQKGEKMTPRRTPKKEGPLP